MGKHRYSSVDFNRVDWKGLSEDITGTRAVWAVDVAKERYFATLLDVEHQVLVTFRWTHPWQTAEVVERMKWLGQTLTLEAVMEPSGTYGDALAWQLRQAGIALYRVSPKRVHDAAEIFDGVPSLHDTKAAYLIGRLHLQGVSQAWREPDEERRELMALSTRLCVCKRRHQAAINVLEAYLSRHWPESPAILGLNSASLCALISAYGDAACVRADPQGAAALLRRTGHGGLSQEKVQELLDSARHSVGVPCLEAERELLQSLGAEIVQTRQRLREIEREVSRRVGQTPVLMQMSTVIGKISAAVLIATLGSPEAYPQTASYLKAIGLNLKERSSGKHKGKLKITKRGPSVARFYLYYAALRLIARDPLVKRWYEFKTNRPGAVKNKTTIELMRKLAGALWHVARGEPFDVGKMFNIKAVASV
jgi:transposase